MLIELRDYGKENKKDSWFTLLLYAIPCMGLFRSLQVINAFLLQESSQETEVYQMLTTGKYIHRGTQPHILTATQANSFGSIFYKTQKVSNQIITYNKQNN